MNGKLKDNSLAPSQDRLQLLFALRGFALDVALPCEFQSSVDRSRNAFLLYHWATATLVLARSAAIFVALGRPISASGTISARDEVGWARYFMP